jgi:GDPmannose 4,6-dehydratase
LFDLATTTGTFHAGVGQGWIHNSPRRGLEFVTRKVSYNTAKIKLGLANELRMGNLDAQRDWGFAGDYVKAMWMMLQQDKPDDYVIATGVTHSVERLLDVAFSSVDLDWEKYVVQDERFMRPAEVDLLVGDASKAGKGLGWEPSISFEQLVQMMVEADLQLLKEQQRL